MGIASLHPSYGLSITFRLWTTMSRLAAWVWRACSALGLQAELGFRLVLPSGRAVVALARIASLGAPNGMLLFRAYDEISDHIQELQNACYGYSVVDEPWPDEEFDMIAVQEMFRDWGWSGQLGGKPAWMR
jgi:hypothetical protein